jgi:hypothetical protein
LNPTIKVTTGGQEAAKKFAASLATLTRKKVYVGIPATTAEERIAQLTQLAFPRVSTKKPSKRRKRYIALLNKSMINNAQLLYIQTNGSPMKHIPARPVIEPAIKDPDNQALFMPEFEAAAKAALDGKPERVDAHLRRAGLIGQNVCRAWFVNPKNGWAPNAPSTIAAKGSARPLIDTGAMRKSITFVVSEDAL